ncbi:MAG: thiamine pyrophosphate-binding protein [Chloroflexi bacterium]|nr:thiamine pyrophosphate-binding protein [Chloroflexota bacterium]
MAEVTGARLIVRSLQEQGISTIFDLPGDPVSAIVNTAGDAGMQRITFRHEQAVAMAAQAYGYVTRSVGVGVVASGPAMTNAVTGLATAWANTWPMLLIGGASEMGRRGLGDFQETPQVAAAAPFCKWSVAVEDVRRIPWFVATAVRRAMSGRPGPVYLDLPADIISGTVDESEVVRAPVMAPIPRPGADPTLIEQAVQAIEAAERPLLIIGKGAAWSDAGAEASALVDALQVPFVPSPMGKGVVPDDHPLAFAGARSYALANADLVILAGARFNWLFHFGEAPRFAPGVKVIQIDIDPEEIGNNVPATVGLVGDAQVVFKQITEAASRPRRRLESPWVQALEAERQKNADAIAPMVNSDAPFTNLYRMYRELNEVADRNAYVVADGESTMALSRVMQSNFEPRHRLDAGVSGCMGTGVPYAIGTQVGAPGKQVISVNGDYAFGWNGIEIDTAVRHKLPIVFVVANNGTVRSAGAFTSGPFTPDDAVRYDKMMDAFGGHSEHVTAVDELRPALERALGSGRTALVNVAIDPQGGRKRQQFSWLDRLGRMRYTGE